eukprot:CAMPEP_0201541878 /NCGR_PEP_ID=MMETSP0161_2-20130828/71714_1 /ASSEMBLY_ACC=CAM_ASM_000251 /TAXON_ID=180227 /ORGANISM="Neoparamoeba aestuarina, Strain SoJaBio B1-5/56/2" /LENGTH=367 /DNA_ID=CAMNT_0047949445 /DNA_START=723 /DNA_END=1826 /DNA_ORIENTATION=-
MATLKDDLGLSSFGLRQQLLRAIDEANEEAGQQISNYFVEDRQQPAKPFFGKLKNAVMYVPVYKLILPRTSLPSEQDFETFLISLGRWRAMGPSSSFRVWEIALQSLLDDGSTEAYPLCLDISSPLPTPCMGGRRGAGCDGGLKSVTEIMLLSDRFDGHLQSLIHPSEHSFEKVVIQGSDPEIVCHTIAEQFLVYDRNSVFLPNSVLTPKNILWRQGRNLNESELPLTISDLEIMLFPFPLMKEEEGKGAAGEGEVGWRIPHGEMVGKRLRRWGAPELRKNTNSRFSPESSGLVWNLALTLWSLFSGSEPYSDLSVSSINPDTKLIFVKPSSWSDKLYSVLSRCVLREAKERPDLSCLCKDLKALCP